MSFILDALKKSEADRQRQSGPALFEVKVAPPRSRLPLWAVAIAVLLLVNLGIVLWLLLRHPAHAANETAALPSAPPAAAATLPPAATAALAAAAPAAASAPLTTAGAPPAAPPAAPPSSAAPPAAAPPSAGATQTGPAVEGAAAPQATANRSEPAGSEGGNPADYAPAVEPPADAAGGHVRRGTVSGVPLYQDAAAVPGVQIPQLRLDLHVYAPHPQDRFVMINMHKVHEGDTLPEGVHVDSITPEGALLSYNGSRFLMPRD